MFFLLRKLFRFNFFTGLVGLSIGFLSNLHRLGSIQILFPPTMKGDEVCRCRTIIRPKSGISTMLNASSSYISSFLADNLLKTKSFTIFINVVTADITLCRLPRHRAVFFRRRGIPSLDAACLAYLVRYYGLKNLTTIIPQSEI